MQAAAYGAEAHSTPHSGTTKLGAVIHTLRGVQASPKRTTVGMDVGTCGAGSVRPHTVELGDDGVLGQARPAQHVAWLSHVHLPTH